MPRQKTTQCCPKPVDDSKTPHFFVQQAYCPATASCAYRSSRGWAGHVARMGETRGVYRVLVGKPEEKRPLGRPRRRWEDNIKIDLQEVGFGGWTGSSWLRIREGGGHL